MKERESAINQVSTMDRLICSMIVILTLFGCHVKGQRAQRSADRPYQSLLFVDNGQRWGTWGLKEMCPLGYFAAGFSLKVSDKFFLFDLLKSEAVKRQQL